MKKRRFLVVDDEPLNLEIIAEFLDNPLYELDLVLNAEQAMAKLDMPDAEYAIIILDRMMPGINGIELLHNIKAEQRFQRVPVIMQTAASTPEQVREGIEAGAYYYLTKPYEPKVLLAIIRAALADVERQMEHASAAERMQQQSEALRLLTHAEFHFATLDEVHNLAALLSNLCPEPDTVIMGLTELLVNAIEHGNLGLSYAEKSRLSFEGGWEEEVTRRQSLPEYRERVATAGFVRVDGEIRFTISDQGNGFAWQDYLEIDPKRAFDPNGRGIAMAKQISFNRLEYQGRGNKVLATVSIPQPGQVTIH